MGNHLQDILSHWHPNRDRYQWVLGTVVSTEGSSYRKAGAMMMFNDRGEFFGLLSGGCLEKALFNDVKKVISFNQARVVVFDSTGDTDVAWQLGLGCGGKVHILLQPVTAANHYQQLCELWAGMNTRRQIQYSVNLRSAETAATSASITTITESSLCNRVDEFSSAQPSGLDLDSRHWLSIALTARRHLAVFGGGIDAVPLVHMANNLGWQITVIDHRVAYAQQQHFISAHAIIREQAAHEDVINLLAHVDAALVMTHNIQLDASALTVLLPTKVQYIGLLGPVHRKNRVLAKGGLKSDSRIYGPMGLALGGELPESIALSALAQCHQVLEKSSVQAAPVENRARRV